MGMNCSQTALRRSALFVIAMLLLAVLAACGGGQGGTTGGGATAAPAAGAGGVASGGATAEPAAESEATEPAAAEGQATEAAGAGATAPAAGQAGDVAPGTIQIAVVAGAMRDTMQKLADKYEQANPGTTIEIINEPEGGAFEALIAAGNQPDIITGSFGYMPAKYARSTRWCRSRICPARRSCSPASTSARWSRTSAITTMCRSA
jgi:ABC-type glycerol-3-phosphate transport system substrate-binding protein